MQTFLKDSNISIVNFGITSCEIIMMIEQIHIPRNTKLWITCLNPKIRENQSHYKENKKPNTKPKSKINSCFFTSCVYRLKPECFTYLEYTLWAHLNFITFSLHCIRYLYLTKISKMFMRIFLIFFPFEDGNLFLKKMSVEIKGSDNGSKEFRHTAFLPSKIQEVYRSHIY